MTGNLITVRKYDDLKVACQAILDNHIDGVGVLDTNGNLCGILSKTDITRAVGAMN